MDYTMFADDIRICDAGIGPRTLGDRGWFLLAGFLPQSRPWLDQQCRERRRDQQRNRDATEH
jgi:hypothetical protein